MKGATTLFLVSILIGGCTYTAEVAPTMAPAAEIMPDRQLSYPASIYIEPELESLSRDIRPSFVCSAHNYPLNAGNAITSTFRNLNEEIFSDVIPGGSSSQGANGAVRHIVYQYEGFNPRLNFATGFWTGTAQANVEVIIKVIVYDENGMQLMRTIVDGQGFAERDGECGVGAETLAEATQVAIRRAAENYVHKVVNSDRLGQPTNSDQNKF